MPKPPDRITKMIDREWRRWVRNNPGAYGWLEVTRICLRLEQQAVRRLVRKIKALHLKTHGLVTQSNDPCNAALAKRILGGIEACDDILVALRRRG
jgi:hypothetical protein